MSQSESNPFDLIRQNIACNEKKICKIFIFTSTLYVHDSLCTKSIYLCLVEGMCSHYLLKVSEPALSVVIDLIYFEPTV